MSSSVAQDSYNLQRRFRPESIMIGLERFEQLMSRAVEYKNALCDVTLEPVNVFEPLNKQLLDELELIREVSRGLQKLKNEELAKAVKAKQDAAKENEKTATEEKSDANEPTNEN